MRPTVSGTLLFATMTIVGVARAQAQTQTQAQDPPSQTQAPATEKTDRKWPRFGIALGPGLRELVPVGDGTSPQANFTIVARFMRSGNRTGFVPAVRLGLRRQSTSLVDASGAGLGSAYLRTFMAGAGWSQRIAWRLSTVHAFTLGHSWNGIDSTPTSERRIRLTVPTAVKSVSNSIAWELSSRLWLDVNPRVSVMAGVAYLHTRPDLILIDGTTRRWNADQVKIQTGIAFTILKPVAKRR